MDLEYMTGRAWSVSGRNGLDKYSRAGGVYQ